MLGAFLVNVTTAGSVATSLGIAAGNTLEAVVGTYLVRRYARGRYAFEHSRDIFRFAGLAAVGSTTLSATVGVSSLLLGGFLEPARSSAVWLTWWLGDVVSDLGADPRDRALGHAAAARAGAGARRWRPPRWPSA